MTTNMIRADIDVRSFYRWAGSRGMISRTAFDPGFAMHCLLTESFGRDLAPKPFRVIIPRDRSRQSGILYGYAECDAGSSETPRRPSRVRSRPRSCPRRA